MGREKSRPFFIGVSEPAPKLTGGPGKGSIISHCPPCASTSREAGARPTRGGSHSSEEEVLMSYEEALRLASRDEAFKATIYAMNTLLIHRGIYTQEEFQQLFVEWVRKEDRKNAQ